MNLIMAIVVRNRHDFPHARQCSMGALEVIGVVGRCSCGTCYQEVCKRLCESYEECLQCGHCVRAFSQELFAEYNAILHGLGVTPANGSRSVCKNISSVQEDERKECLQEAKDVTVTMLKPSGPIMCGHCVKAFSQELFARYNAVLRELGVTPTNGLRSVCKKISSLQEAERKECLQEAKDVSVTMLKISGPIMCGHCVKAFSQEFFAQYNAILRGLGVNPDNGSRNVCKKIGSLQEDERKECFQDAKDVCEISDPIMCGHCVKAYCQEVFAKYNDILPRLGVTPDNGSRSVYKKVSALPENERKAVSLRAIPSRNVQQYSRPPAFLSAIRSSLALRSTAGAFFAIGLPAMRTTNTAPFPFPCACVQRSRAAADDQSVRHACQNAEVLRRAFVLTSQSSSSEWHVRRCRGVSPDL